MKATHEEKLAKAAKELEAFRKSQQGRRPTLNQLTGRGKFYASIQTAETLCAACGFAKHQGACE